MSALPPGASFEQIEDELLFQHTMLESLEEDDEERRNELESTVRQLENRLAAHQSHEPPATDTQSDDSYKINNMDWSSNIANMPGAFPSSARASDMAQLDGPSASSGSTSPGSSASSLGQTAPSSAMKRPYGTADSTPDADEASRFKRHAPTPRIHMPPVATSQSMTSVAREELRERHRRIEDEHQRRRQRETDDAAYAASLSQYHSPPSAGPSRLTPMTANKSLSRHDTSPSQWHTVFRPQNYHPVKSEQPQSPSPYPFGASSSQVKRETHTSPSGYSSLSTPAMKTETTTNLSSIPRHSGAIGVIDLTGSDEEKETIDLTRQDAVRKYSMPSRPTVLDHQNKQQWLMHEQNLRRQQEMIRFQEQTRLQAQRSRQLQQAQQLQREMQMYGSMQSVGYSPLYPHAMGIPGMQQGKTSIENFSSGVGQANGFFGDLSQLANMVTGRSLNDDPELAYLGTQARAADYMKGPDYADILNRYDYPDPEKTREELLKLVENIQPDEEDVVIDEDVPVEAMTVKLKPYQNTGLKWLQKMEDGSNKGGILADDMGLGKTVQAISLIVTRRSEDPVNKTTLIVAPVALLRQWQQEIETRVKAGRHRLHVFIHHSSSKKKTHRELREFDVVLTTFGTLAAEGKRIDKYEDRKRNDPEARPRDDERCLFIGPECRWYRVIVDEAQCIKNRNTRTSKAACLINSRTRFCMTGTPMMNSVEELYSLIHFLRIRPYNDWNKFRSDFVTPLKAHNEAHRQGAMTKLQAVLKAILLRRNKQTKINGRPILHLPTRSLEVDNGEFSKDEQEFYTSIETKSAITVNKYLKAGTVGRQYAQILVMLLRLRQACCHPHLIKDFGIVGAAAEISQETMDDICKQLDEAVINRIKETNGVFECPICYDAVENPAIFVPCGHDACSECFTRMTDPSQGVLNGDVEGGRSAKCPECRGPINTKNVIDYECFKKIHIPVGNQAKDPDDVETEGEVETDSDDDSSDDEDNDKSLGGFVVEDDVETESDDGGDTPIVETGKDLARRQERKALPQQKLKVKKSKKAKGKQKKDSSKKLTIPELKKLASRSAKHKIKYLRMIRKNFISSAKLDKTMEILRPIMESPEREKVIIFSQWTSLLDLLEIPIADQGWGYRRYDGSMNSKLRAEAVEDFKTKPNVRMMLISLKAGNAGLNLNIANQVIILDPFWNPYIEEQAIDRAHRLGQTRPVKVHRVLVENTVEDRILALQEKKRALISEALDEKASQGVGRLSVRELAYLFGINRNIDDPVPMQGR